MSAFNPIGVFEEVVGAIVANAFNVQKVNIQNSKPDVNYYVVRLANSNGLGANVKEFNEVLLSDQMQGALQKRSVVLAKASFWAGIDDKFETRSFTLRRTFATNLVRIVFIYSLGDWIKEQRNGANDFMLGQQEKSEDDKATGELSEGVATAEDGAIKENNANISSDDSESSISIEDDQQAKREENGAIEDDNASLSSSTSSSSGQRSAGREVMINPTNRRGYKGIITYSEKISLSPEKIIWKLYIEAVDRNARRWKRASLARSFCRFIENWSNGKVGAKLFGSFSYGSCLYSGDIDISIVVDENISRSDLRHDFRKMLDGLSIPSDHKEYIMKCGKCEFEDELSDKMQVSRVPVSVKSIEGNLIGGSDNFKVDVSFRNDHACKTGAILSHFCKFREFRFAMILLKKLFVSRRLLGNPVSSINSVALGTAAVCYLMKMNPDAQLLMERLLSQDVINGSPEATRNLTENDVSISVVEFIIGFIDFLCQLDGDQDMIDLRRGGLIQRDLELNGAIILFLDVGADNTDEEGEIANLTKGIHQEQWNEVKKVLKKFAADLRNGAIESWKGY